MKSLSADWRGIQGGVNLSDFRRDGDDDALAMFSAQCRIILGPEDIQSFRKSVLRLLAGR